MVGGGSVAYGTSLLHSIRIHCLGPVLSATGQLARQRASRQADKRSMMRPTEVANVDSKVANGVDHWQWPSLADEIISESAILEGMKSRWFANAAVRFSSPSWSIRR